MSSWRAWTNPHDRITVTLHGTDKWSEANDWLDEQGFETGDLEVCEIQESFYSDRKTGQRYSGPLTSGLPISTETHGYCYRFKRRDADKALQFKLIFGGAA